MLVVKGDVFTLLYLLLGTLDMKNGQIRGIFLNLFNEANYHPKVSWEDY